MNCHNKIIILDYTFPRSFELSSREKKTEKENKNRNKIAIWTLKGLALYCLCCVLCPIACACPCVYIYPHFRPVNSTASIPPHKHSSTDYQRISLFLLLVKAYKAVLLLRLTPPTHPTQHKPSPPSPHSSSPFETLHIQPIMSTRAPTSSTQRSRAEQLVALPSLSCALSSLPQATSINNVAIHASTLAQRNAESEAKVRSRAEGANG